MTGIIVRYGTPSTEKTVTMSMSDATTGVSRT